MDSLVAIVLAASMAAAPAPSAEPRSSPAKATAAKVKLKTIATNLEVPWGIGFLPNGDALVAERTTGEIKRVPKNGGGARTVKTIGAADVRAGEGGLLGLAVSPDYKRDKLVYAYYTSRTDNRITRFKLKGAEDPVFTGIRRGFVHNGGRIAFGPDGKLYVGTGEVGETGLSQQADTPEGKILRLNANGSVPKDNPTAGSPVFSLGHRNVQGLAFDKQGRLWAAEFGQDRFDEVNLIKPGRNYGWPVVEGRASDRRFENPKVTWRTSEASPSGIAIVGSRLFVAALQGEGVYSIKLDGQRAGTPRLRFGGEFGRVRTVVEAPGGGIWFATSNRDGRGSPRAGDDRIVRAPAR